jgi:plastocyanin
MVQVTISWKGDHGEVVPSNFRAQPEEEVRWTAEGSAVDIEFTKIEVFGTEKLTVPAGQTRSLEVEPDAPEGEYTFPVRCAKDPGDGTPPVSMILG